MGKFDEGVMDPICPWCGDDLDVDAPTYDAALEAHISENPCPAYLAEQAQQ